MKKNNLRRCVITKKVLHKDELLRFVILNKVICIDLKNDIKSRGYYFDKKNTNKKQITSFLNKRFKLELSEEATEFINNIQ